MIEALWIGLNLTTLVIVVIAIADAREAQAAVHKLNGKARELAAANRLGREFVRFLIQIILLVLALPSLLDPRESELNYFVLGLMAVAVLNLISSIGDTLSTRSLLAMAATDVAASRKSSLDRIEDQNEALAISLAENTAISEQAVKHADEASQKAEAAFHEANTVNVKIADLNKALLDQGAAREADAARDDAAIETIEDTHAKVVDIHDALPPTT